MSTIAPISVPARSTTPTAALAGARRAEVTPVSVSDEAVARLAYAKHAARGYAHGFDREDWAQAKRELSAGPLRMP